MLGLGQYYAAQKRTLRPSAYLRFHQNRWSSSEEAFVTPELWDPCVDASHRPMLPTHECPIYLGVDGAIKHDSAAIVGVRWDGARLALVLHRIWQPTPEEPLDLEATIEAELRFLCRHYQVRVIRYDPYQLHRSMMGLRNQGLPCEEYPQTSGNCTAMGQALFDLLTGQNIRLYPSPELRTQALNTVSVESTRGWRIAKDKAGKKIDAIVALAMAAVAALDHGQGIAVDVAPDEIERIRREAGLLPQTPGDRQGYTETHVSWDDWPDA